MHAAFGSSHAPFSALRRGQLGYSSDLGDVPSARCDGWTPWENDSTMSSSRSSMARILRILVREYSSKSPGKCLVIRLVRGV